MMAGSESSQQPSVPPTPPSLDLGGNLTNHLGPHHQPNQADPHDAPRRSTRKSFQAEPSEKSVRPKPRPPQNASVRMRHTLNPSTRWIHGDNSETSDETSQGHGTIPQFESTLRI